MKDKVGWFFDGSLQERPQLFACFVACPRDENEAASREGLQTPSCHISPGCWNASQVGGTNDTGHGVVQPMAARGAGLVVAANVTHRFLRWPVLTQGLHC